MLLIALVVSFVVRNFVPTTEVRLGSGVYHLQVASNEIDRRQGLSEVEHIYPNGGLLMVFDNDDKHGIWMKDMRVSLDIIWLNNDKKVVYIVKNATPEMSTDVIFTPKTDARYVIELPQGSVDSAGIKVDMIATFDVSDEEVSGI